MGWWKLKIVFWLLFTSGLFLSTVAQVEISEVMYAPSEKGGGQYNEWVELSNGGNISVNLSTCLLDGKDLPSFLLPPSQSIVFSRKPEVLLGLHNHSFLFFPLSLSLNNDQDLLNLTGSSDCSSVMNYSSVLGGYKNNLTLERRADATWGAGLIDGGTPGLENSIWNVSLPDEDNSTV